MQQSVESFILSSRNYATGTLQGQHAKDYLENLPRICDNIGRNSTWVVLDGICNQLIAADESPTVGVLGALYAKSRCSEFNAQFETFLVQFASVIESNPRDPNAFRACATLVTGICEAIGDQMIRRKQPILGINLIRQVINKVQKNSRQLTGVHAVLFQLCLSAHCLKPALPYLVDDVDDFTNDIKGGESKNLLLYFYYGGMVFAALKRFSEAIYFFEACIRVPASTLSHIMLEAYKKYVLICLIHLGDVPAPHKSAVQIVNRVLKPSAQAYVDLHAAFTAHSANELASVISRNQDAFRRDDNFGLVKQVKSAFTKINIQRLTKTFLTLSLADVAARVQLSSPQEAEKVVLSMIEDGQIYAKINQLDGMVVFLDNKEKYDNPKVLTKVENQMSKCIELNKRLSAMNDTLATNPEFISKVVLTSGGVGSGSSLGLGEDQDMGVSSVASSSSASTSKIPSFSM